MRTQSGRSTASARKTGRRSARGASAGAASRANGTPREVESASPAPRTGAKRTIVSTMKELPNFLRLLGGLLTDRRVSNTDKLLVAGAIGYILLPIDLVPDFIPFLGEVDDLFLLVLALQRLIANAGRAVIEDHWMGEPGQLRSLDLERVLVAAAFFLPRRIRRRLRAIGREI
ncbi:MAG TPA: YkvA family protein [Gemmatimonadaceae bacterium]|nr:YkvA family protein [Gemmatimonadaceae bacterium]